MDAEQRLGEGAFPRTRLADEPHRLAGADPEIDMHERRDVLAPLAEGLRDAAQLDDRLLAGGDVDRVGRRLRHVGDAVGVMAEGIVGGADLDARGTSS